MSHKNYAHKSTIKVLVEDYGRSLLTPAELIGAIVELDPDYFNEHGQDFKTLMSKTFINKNHLEPRERVAAWAAFYEAYYDFSTGYSSEESS